MVACRQLQLGQKSQESSAKPLRSTSRRAISVWSLSPAMVPHVGYQMNVPRGNRIHLETRAAPQKATSIRVHFMQQHAPRASIEAEPRIALALRRARWFVSHRGKTRFTPIFVLHAERIARTVPWSGATASLSDSALVRGL